MKITFFKYSIRVQFDNTLTLLSYFSISLSIINLFYGYLDKIQTELLKKIGLIDFFNSLTKTSEGCEIKLLIVAHDAIYCFEGFISLNMIYLEIQKYYFFDSLNIHS